MYTHLTQDERYQIGAYRSAGKPLKDIAQLLGRSHSTITRELARNGSTQGYKGCHAQALAVERAKASRNARRIESETWVFVAQKLALYWSPAQISGYRARFKLPAVSHESIYLHIYAQIDGGIGQLHRYLRCQKKRRKRYGGRDRRGTIPNRVSIDLRPAVVATRERFGDFEVDLMIGPAHQHGLVTINERFSRYAMIAWVPNKQASCVSAVVLSLLMPFKTVVHTITSDNGREFAQHEAIAKALSADYYFAHPYASWERGANENMNGLIRQFFPKKMRLNRVTQADLDRACNLLNHRPRACLNFRTPHEVFFEQLNYVNQSLALRA